MDNYIDRYTYRVTWSGEDQEFVGLCAELPGLSWLDSSQGQALAGIRQLVSGCLADLRDSGEPVPEPLSTRHYSGKLVLRITPETHRSLTIQAAESGVSLNRYIASRL
jgi:predicted HicB family RNase H-like nuclease